MASVNDTSFDPADLDPNVWYQITEARVDDYDKDSFSSMLQQDDDGTFNVFGADAGQFWQFQPVDNIDGRYAMRLSKTSLRQQLSVCYVEDEIADTKTQPCMADSNGSDEQKWEVASWGDKTFRFLNVANGTKIWMDCHPGSPVFMSSNIDTDVYQPAQHWLMSSASEVNDGAYSTVFSDGPTSTGTAAKTTGTNSDSPASTTGASSSPDSSDSSSSSSGLSTGAAAGIGVGVGVVVIAIAVALFFFWRKRRAGAASTAGAAEMAADHGSPDKSSSSQAWGSPYAGYYKPPGQGIEEQPGYGVVHEAPTNTYHSELDSTSVARTDTPR